jgi:hypothetical protein
VVGHCAFALLATDRKTIPPAIAPKNLALMFMAIVFRRFHATKVGWPNSIKKYKIISLSEKNFN